MALNTKMSDTSVNAEANALAALADGGYLRIYSGTQPADANSGLSGNTQLAELRFATPAFGGSTAGLIIANPLLQDSDADNTGTATWFRVLKSDGTTVLWDGSCGISGCNMNLNSVSIQQHAIVSVTDFRHQVTE